MTAQNTWFSSDSAFDCIKKVIATYVLIIVSFYSQAQDPNLPPSGNFDLRQWKITLPDQSEVSETDLADGFERDEQFYTDPQTGAMVFRCRNDGETGGSTYPRSELREMIRAGNTSISTQGIGLNNWVFSSSTAANQEASGGVDGTMTATLAVDHVSTTGEDRMVGRVIVGQIHASVDEPCRIYYRKLPGNTKGSIYFAHEPTNSSEQWYEMIGSRSNSASDPSDGIALGEKFSYEIDVVGNTLTVTIMREGKPDVSQVVDMSNSGFADDWMYFKAGNYNQNNSGESGDYAQVSFFDLNVIHSAANEPPTARITSPTDGETLIEGDDLKIEVTASDSDGTISSVEFYEGTNKLGEVNNAPYAFTWENVAQGKYNLTAVAVDDKGSESTSSIVEVNVNPQPTGYDVPYDIPRFQPILAGSKLQAPTSSTAATASELMNGFSSDNFYVVDGDKIAFNQSGSSMRTELRHETNWLIDDGNRSLHGRLKIEEQTCEQVTVVQIHDDANAGDGPNKPLLRIYRHQTRTPENHIWAAIKTDTGGENTMHIDLGETPTGYWGFDVRLVEGNMIISINGEEKSNEDVSFWNFPSYWKAGVYLQDDGTATAHFDELYEGDGSIVNHAPGISITSPSNGETFAQGENLTIAADAFDTDGSIEKVEFYNGNQKLGEDTTIPYSFDWNNLAEGSYSLTAIATDNESATTKSLGVKLTVGVQYLLDISTSGEGFVSTNPSETSYSENTVVSLNATPAEGYQFDGWGGDLSGRQNPISITMDSDKAVTASFIEIPTFLLDVNAQGNGTITISPQRESYEEGMEVTLTAVPDTGHQFNGWSGDISENQEQVVIKTESDLSVTANFGLILSIEEVNRKALTAYPNPISTAAFIEYELSTNSKVHLTISDMMGRHVDTLVDQEQNTGIQKVKWIPNDSIPDGIYFVQLIADGRKRTSKILINRN